MTYFFQRHIELIRADLGRADTGPGDRRQVMADRIATMPYDELLKTRVAFGTAASLRERLGEIAEDLGLSGIVAELNPAASCPSINGLRGSGGRRWARLVREWLDANAAAGYLEPVDGSYRLPPEQAMALANEDSPVFVAPGQSVLASCFLDLDKVLAAFRGDGGFPWGEHHHRMFHGVEKFFRPGYQAHLTTSWLPALDDVVPKLQAGAKVGHLRSSTVRAWRFSASGTSTTRSCRPGDWPWAA